MAMLAERKRKEKWCLNPRGKAWSEDNTKFGQRLLEKMGWNAGQGLGINNQGPTEIVKVKKKDDSKGLGFKDNGEEWLKTTSDYNELLGQLGSSLESEEDKEGGDLASSLEDRSKNSKTRVHYHKFTRGKDLSRYSEKDLASIIGPDVVKLKTIDTSAPDYTINQVNKGSSAEYFSHKKKLSQPSQLDYIKTESDDISQRSNNSEEDNVIIDTKSKKKKKYKTKNINNSENEKETEENSDGNASKKKKRKKEKESENSSSADYKKINSLYSYEENQTKDGNENDESLNNFEEPLKKKKKKKHFECSLQIEENKNCRSNEYSAEIDSKGSKKKKKNLNDDIQRLSEQANLNESNNDNINKNKVSKVKEKHLPITELDVNQSNLLNAENKDTSKKKKKLHHDSCSIDSDNQKDQPDVNEKMDKIKKTKNNISYSEAPKIELDNKKKAISERENNCKSLTLETGQEESTFKTKNKKTKMKRECNSDYELHKDQSPVKINQVTPSDSEGFLEVLGRKTRLRKINLHNKPAEHVRYETEDFMSLTSSGPKNSSHPSYSPEIVNNTNIMDNEKCPIPKVLVEPSQQDLDLPKSVIIHEYRLLTKKCNELNLKAPEMKIIIKNKTLARATCRKLKQLQKSKQMKTVLPLEHVAEVEAAVKKYTEELKPKIEMINKLAEIEKKTVLIAEELPDESSLQLKEEEETPHILDPEKVKIVKKMSKQLKKLLEEKSNEETVKSTENDQITPNVKRKADNLSELNFPHKKPKISLGRTETVDSASKENAHKTNSLQKRIEERLKELAEQMKMLKEGKKPVITPTLQPKPVIKDSYSTRNPHQHFRSFTRGRSQGVPNGRTYPGDSVDSQNKTEPNRHLFFSENENGDSLSCEPKTFEHPGLNRGVGIGRIGTHSAIPRGGWGILKSYGMSSDIGGGGYNSRDQLSRGSFVRGRTFRGRGRGELLRGRGRISQNNFDAKQYAEKCKKLNKVPEIAFKGVDLKFISGYAASQAVDSTINPSKPITDNL